MRSPRYLRLVFVLATGLGATVACSPERASLGPGVGGDAAAPDFTSHDASQADSGSFGGSCPTNECPAGRTTCENEPFPCSVDLQSNDDNCGACGVRCPTDRAFLTQFRGVMHCVAGECRFVCDQAYADCNGRPEDGCEKKIAGPGANDIQNCGACGNVCDDICVQGACGCPGGTRLCPDGMCRKLPTDQNNCGACGNVCPPDTEPPFPAEWNIVRTCQGGKCNQPVCVDGRADCNYDFLEPGSDGCETPIAFDAKNCGGCGNECAAGEVCLKGQCICPCDAICNKRLNTDPHNCGACGNECPGDWRSADGNSLLGVDPSHGRPVCEQGICGYACTPNWADCDNDISNGCETDLLDDPLNCGTCGVRCDGIEGQACVDGRCLTKGCEEAR